MRILLGSSNPEKVQRIRNMLAGLPIEIVDAIGEWTLGIAFALVHKQVYSQSFSSRSIFVAEPSASMIQGRRSGPFRLIRRTANISQK